MATAIRRQRQARRHQSIDTLHLTIGFVDLVGFTTLSSRMSSRQLAEVIDRFESRRTTS
jgi:class 3 adenylate cyclase